MVAHLPGGLCFVGLALAWLLGERSDRFRFVSEFLAGAAGVAAAVVLKASFTGAALLFAAHAVETLAVDELRGALGVATALALLATTWIDMPLDRPLDTPPRRRRWRRWWWHPVAAQFFFGTAAAYQLAQLAQLHGAALMVVGVHLALTSWLLVVTVHAAGLGRRTHVQVCHVLIDRLSNRSLSVRVIEWPATLALTAAFAISP